MTEEKGRLDCRCDPPNTGNPRVCVGRSHPGACLRICVRLSADLAAQLSPELQKEWAKGQAQLMLMSPGDPDLAKYHEVPPHLREALDAGQMATPTGRPEPPLGAKPPPAAWGASSIYME